MTNLKPKTRKPPAPKQSAPSIEVRPIDALLPYARNARTHSDAQVAQIAASLVEFGWTSPILTDGAGSIIAGHGRLLAARKVQASGGTIPNWPDAATVPTIPLAHLTPAQRRAYVLADNQLALNAGWDDDLLRVELQDLQDDGFNLDLIGFGEELAGILAGPAEGEPSSGEGSGTGSLADRFMVPPFSVLNAREGWWQDRKRAWLALGIKSELGRGQGLIMEAAQVTSPGLNYYRDENKKAGVGGQRQANATPGGGRHAA